MDVDDFTVFFLCKNNDWQSTYVLALTIPHVSSSFCCAVIFGRLSGIRLNIEIWVRVSSVRSGAGEARCYFGPVHTRRG